MKQMVDTEKLLAEAIKVKANAHAPYSKFQVGAALVDEKGKIFIGCNVENSSYGGTVCAERNAIGAMVAGGGKKFTDLVVVTDIEAGCPPCGICRQVLSEFVQNPETSRIHLANRDRILKTYTLKELLPVIFDGSFLTGQS